MREASLFSRRRFLKASSLFVPATFARSQSLNLADLPFIANTSGVTLDPVTTGWGDRVVANGGVRPSGAILSAANTWYLALVSAGIDTKMLGVNLYAPSNLIAAITPFIVGSGFDPWTNTSFVSGDLTVNGLKGNGDGNGTGTKYLNTGVSTNAFTSDNDCGLTLYNYDNPNDSVTGSMGVSTAAFTQNSILKLSQGGTTYFECWNVLGANGSGFCTVGSQTAWTGFTCANRTGAAAGAIYQANSGTAFASVASLTGIQGSRPGAVHYVHALNVIGGTAANFDRFRISFAAIHHGLTSGQAQALYNATQALRTSFGGGYA